MTGQTDAQTLPRLITNLHPLEKKAVLALTRQVLAQHGPDITSISLFSTGRKNARGAEDVEVLIITAEDDPQFEDRVLDLVADVVVDTGVYLTVRCFSADQYHHFSRMNLPLISRIQDSAVSLFQVD